MRLFPRQKKKKYRHKGDHKVLGKLVRRQAGSLKLNDFDEKIAIADGAGWIHPQLQVNVPTLDAFILDFYHFSEHIWDGANQCFGVNSDDGKKFAEDMLHIARHEGIGGGPTEAMCKVLTCRLKGAEPITALVALEQSNIWNRYWNSQKEAA